MSIINKTWTEADVIADAIGERSTRDAAEWLNEKVPADYQITHATVHNWVTGMYKPAYGFLYVLIAFYDKGDPRYKLAHDLHQMRKKAIITEMP